MFPNQESIQYVNFSEVAKADFVRLLNNPRVREHLVEYEAFDVESIDTWINEKEKTNSTPGCKIRAIVINDRFAGWCGIQQVNEQFELAMVIDDKYWGIGTRVFHESMSWAKAQGHHEVVLHLLESRPEYRFLHKLASSVSKTNIMGREFTTYHLAVI